MTAKHSKHPSSLMDLQTWEKFQESLSMMTGLALLTLDPAGKMITEPSNVNGFCLRYLRRSPKNQALCDKSHHKAARAVAASGKPAVYTCHAGFSYFAIPVMINNAHVTTLVGGQVMRRDFNRDGLKKLTKELGISVPDFEGELQRIHTMSEDKFLKTKELIENLVGMITQLNFEKFGLTKKVAELSALHEIADLVGSVGDLSKMLHQLCEKITRIVGMEKCALIVRDKSMERFIVATSDKLSQEFRNSYIELTRDILFERRFLIGEQLHVEKVDEVRDYGGFRELYEKAGIATRVTVPLVVREHVLGLLELYPPARMETKKEFTGLVIQVAYQTAVAIDNASIFSHAERLASTDGLTGLVNYRTFQHLLFMELKRAGRYNVSLTMIMVDIDDFKSINETFGHLIGNIVLSEIAEILKNSVREVDIVSRFGGEEFAIVLPETDLDGAMILAERLRTYVSEFHFSGPGEKVLRLTVSVGVALFDKDMKTAEDFIEVADRALLKAKAGGKDKVVKAPQKKKAAPAPKPAAKAKKPAAKAKAKK